MPVDVVTGDRDLLQLVRDDGPTVRVLFTVKGVTELAEFDEAAVLAKKPQPDAASVSAALKKVDDNCASCHTVFRDD